MATFSRIPRALDAATMLTVAGTTPMWTSV